MRPTPHRSDDRSPRARGARREHRGVIASLCLVLAVGAIAILPSAAAADECPNAEVRAQQQATHLPDCRAYEMLSPLDTQGQRAVMNAPHDNGNQVLYSSVGGFAGTPSLMGLGIQYLASRDESGWTTAPLAPPATQYDFLSFGQVVDYSDDLKRTLWITNKTEDAGTYRWTPVVREADGEIVVAGPTIEDSFGDDALVGTSSDLDHIVIGTRARPALTDGTVDTRAVSRASLIVATRASDGSIDMRQVAYRAGATMFPTCALMLGGANGSAGTSARGAVSDDAQTIIFTTTGLSSCTTVANQRVWAKVGSADPIDLAQSQCTVDCGAAQRAVFEGAARDGSRVYFTTEQKLVDGDLDSDVGTKNDLYEYDFDASGSKLIPVTIGSSATGAGVVRVMRVSPDGSHVYFVANGRPLTGPNARGVTPQQGNQNLYVYHREPGQASGTTTFVAAFDPLLDTDQWAADVRRKAQTSESGRYLLFASAGDLTGDRRPGDTFLDLFRYDAQTDDLRRIWTDGQEHNGMARKAPGYMSTYFGSSTDGGKQKNWSLGRQMSEDGQLILLDTAERLSASDVNDQIDSYLWRAATGTLTLLTSGKSGVPARSQGMTPSGDSLFVSTSAPLVKSHTSGAVALYEVRTGGGFLEPAAPAPRCEGDACQGALTSAPVLDSIGSIGFAGRGNMAQPSRPVRYSVSVSRLRAVVGSAANLRVKVGTAGRISVSGASIRKAGRSTAGARTVSVGVQLSAKAKRTLAKRKRLSVRVKVVFRPQAGGSASKTVTVTFKQPKQKKGGR